MRLVNDFETANPDTKLLSEAGAVVYAQHPLTEILCYCMIVAETGQELWWVPGVNDEAREAIRLLAADPANIFEAHNAAFEQSIWQYIMVEQLGMPPLPPERWDCTMARAYYRGCPGKLDLLARVLNLPQQKDMDGHRLTIGLSSPMTKVAWGAKRPPDVTKAEWGRQFKPGAFERSRPALLRVKDYCLQDCRTEIAAGHAVGPLSSYERRVWELDQRINQRGIKIDLDYVAASKEVVRLAAIPLLKEFEETTGLRPTQTAKLLGWCHERGFPIESLNKETLKKYGITGIDDGDVLGAEDDGGPQPVLSVGMPDTVRRALEIRAVLGSASIAKLDKMQRCVASDGRVHYAIQYHGAGTGRWAGRLFQPHNFPRGKIEGGHDPEDLVAAIMRVRQDPQGAVDFIQLMFGDPIAAVASGLRHAIVAEPGHAFCTGDFVGIEMRDVLGLAGQHDKCELLAKIGSGAYLAMAEKIYRVPAGQWSGSKERIDRAKKEHVAEYTIGKNTLLGSGFGLGWKTFREKYGSDRPESFARDCINVYREEFAPKVPALWYGLEDAALKAVHDKWHASAYGCTYEYCGDWLACHLPDGQTMWYRQPEFEANVPMRWNPSDRRDVWWYWTFKDGRWQRVQAYGGLLTENVVQKRARGYLVEAMFRLEAAGFPLVMTVHDECMSEVPEAMADHRLYEQIMAEPTQTALDYKVPIAVEGWSGPRYRK